MALSCSKTERGEPGAWRAWRREVRRQGKKATGEGFDAVLLTVEDRTQAEICFEVFEGFLDLCKQHVELPDLGRVICAEVGAQQVAAFATAELAQFVLAQAEGESAVFCDLDFYHSPRGWILAFGGAKSLSSNVSRAGARRWSSASLAQSFLSWRRRMARSLAWRSRERAST